MLVTMEFVRSDRYPTIRGSIPRELEVALHGGQPLDKSSREAPISASSCQNEVYLRALRRRDIGKQ